MRTDLKRTVIDSVRNCNGSSRDKEFLAFICCILASSDQQKDQDFLNGLLDNVKDKAHGIWEYIDQEHYMIDYAFDLRVLKLMMLLHEIILTTQTIEVSVKISMNYNSDPKTFFFRLFGNAGMGEYLTDEKVDMFLSLMVAQDPEGLGLWKDLDIN